MQGQPQVGISYTRRNKYHVVAGLLRRQQGTLLDVGARDRVLARYLDTERIAYRSADLGDGHDYRLDLEEPLPLPDRSFDIVTALDVLEHVERTHAAFAELARITRRHLIVALPVMDNLYRRVSFLLYGHLGTRKYDLLADYQEDRHRWLTMYPQINQFVAASAKRVGFTVRRVVEEVEGSPVSSVVSLAAAYAGLGRRGMLTTRCIYVMSRSCDS